MTGRGEGRGAVEGAEPGMIPPRVGAGPGAWVVHLQR